MSADKNFDPFVERFAENVYQSRKGLIRLKLVMEDLAQVPTLESGGLRVLDAGCGLANVALELGKKGHQLTLCDISANMLERAREHLAELPAERVEFHHLAMQEAASFFPQPFDLVLCHAVLEWLAEPRAGLHALMQAVAPGGYLSLMIYNKHSLPMRHLMMGNFYRIKRGNLTGQGSTLTPTNPLDPYEVESWLAEEGCETLVTTGMRVFSDYMPKSVRDQRSFEDTFEMERQYARQAPFVYLGRYVHFLVRKPIS